MTFQNTNNRPGEPSGGEDAPRRATSGQARTIIALLIVLILVVVAIGAWLIWGRGGSDRSDRGASTGVASAVPSEGQATGQEEQPDIDSVALLENAGVQSVNPAPVPEAVDAWGDYVKNRSWSGTLRVFEGQDATPVTDDDHSRFPATMNHCGVAMYLVTFRSVNEDVLLDAQLLNAANSIDASETMSDGWMLTTNCDTPQFRFNSSTGISNLGDVAYDVTEYRQSSVAGPAEARSDRPAAAEPTLVECDNGLTIMGRYSDGSWRSTPECDTEKHRRTVRAEGVCGGFGGWEKVSAAEYEDLCGHAPPVLATSPSPDGPDGAVPAPDAAVDDVGQ